LQTGRTKTESNKKKKKVKRVVAMQEVRKKQFSQNENCIKNSKNLRVKIHECMGEIELDRRKYINGQKKSSYDQNEKLKHRH
jgi:hypothetical protein